MRTFIYGVGGTLALVAIVGGWLGLVTLAFTVLGIGVSAVDIVMGSIVILFALAVIYLVGDMVEEGLQWRK